MSSLNFAGRRLDYTEYGSGPRTVVLLHGLLLSQRMHEPLARDLAARGNRVLTLDLLGHGRSDRPSDPAHYSVAAFAEQVVALLDALELDEAVILGTSLGANVALEICHQAPQRVRGTVIEMPVLDNALLACLVAFGPLLIGLELAEPLLTPLTRALRRVPTQRLGLYPNVLIDTVRQEPAPSAAVLRGLFYGRVAPHPSLLSKFSAPSLVIGHRRDPVHPLSDAGMVADALPNARLLEANSIIELRVSPARLTGEIADFLDSCWKPASKAPPRREAAAS